MPSAYLVTPLNSHIQVNMILRVPTIIQQVQHYHHVATDSSCKLNVILCLDLASYYIFGLLLANTNKK